VKFLPKEFEEINYSEIFREIIFWCGAGAVMISIGFWLNSYGFDFAEKIRMEWLDSFAIFCTEKLPFILYALAALVILKKSRKFFPELLSAIKDFSAPKVDLHNNNFFWLVERLEKKVKNYPIILDAVFAFLIAGIVAYVLKYVFAVPRPFEVINLLPLVEVSSPSFPSGHTTLAFSVLLPFYRISKRLGIFWFFAALTIAFARIYENVHYPSDIAAGIFLGGVIGSIVSNPEFKKMIKISWQHLEFRRQSFHFTAGIVVIFAHWAGFCRLREISVLLLIGLLLSVISQYKKIPILGDFLKMFDRPRDENFPGRGAFWFLTGVFLSFVFFDVKIAYAAILIMSVGDSLNHIFPRDILNFHTPWNPRKNWIGVVIGIISGAFAAQFFVPTGLAFIAATISILLETVTLKIGDFYLDDNIIVPLTAGTILTFLM